MDKGYYKAQCQWAYHNIDVAIHNKNGQGLLRRIYQERSRNLQFKVAIHNKNGQGLLQLHYLVQILMVILLMSQSTIKMDKGYYIIYAQHKKLLNAESQSTIKMDKGYYLHHWCSVCILHSVAIHNKNGQGLLPSSDVPASPDSAGRNPQ